ncbi:MAG TPA: hypothetical protein VGM06_12525 [Polyangiaceae bacterium]|jgi:hypothetical protein
MEQAVRALGGMPLFEAVRARPTQEGPALVLTLEVRDPEVLAELRRYTDAAERDRHALAALRVGFLALRAAAGQIDAASIREAGQNLIAEVRELLSTRATETTERISSALTQYLDPQSGLLPQRLQALVREDGELERMLRAHVGADDSILARSLATHLGEGSPIFKLLSPTDANGLRAQLGKTLEQALADQNQYILREFSLDHKGSALARLFAEFSLDDDKSALSRLSKMLASTSEQIGKNLTLDDEASALARLKRELLGTIDQIARGNVEFHAQVREALARLDTRKKSDANTPRHGVTFEERLGALLSEEAQRLGDLHEATGDTTGVIKQCKKGDHVIELAADSAAAHARIVWEAKEKQGYSLRSALEEIDEARRNRRAQVGVFVFSRKTAPEGLELLQRYGSDVVVVWDADDPMSDLTMRAAYSLARALVVREHRTDQESQEAIAEIELAARGVERQMGFLSEVRRWAETVKGHGEKIVDRTGRMMEELKQDVARLDAQVAQMRSGG